MQHMLKLQKSSEFFPMVLARPHYS